MRSTDIQVSTGAHDITVPTSGVFLNMITKTGGNKWSGGTTFTWLGAGTQGRNDTDPTLQKYGFRPNGNTSDFVSDIDVTGGGPLVQNKLRFFGSFRDWRVHQNVPVQASQTVLDQTNITSGLGNFTYQASQNNRLTGFYSRQRYSKPNRLLNNASITVIDSTSDEEDMFDVVQGLWNSVVGKNFFLDARFGLNKILFPTYQNGGNQQSVTDNATGIIYGNFPTNVIRNRDRYQANTTGQYYVDQALGGRHEFKFGFDYSHAVTKNQTSRVDDVAPTYTTASGAFVPVNVTLFATPQNDATALNVLALFAQDSYSVKRLTVVGGIRFEQLEGYLPSQSSPASPFATAGIGGFAAQPRSYDEVRDIVKWNTAGPRASAIFDITGDGKTAAKASAGRYYYVLSTGGGGVSNVNRNANYSEQYTWNDLNGDHKFQLGEQTGVPVVSAVVVNGAILTSIDPNFSRPYTGRVRVRRGPGTGGQFQAECRVHLSSREEPPGDGESRQSVRDHTHQRGRSGDRRCGRYRRRRDVWLLFQALSCKSIADHQRSERVAELQGPRNHAEQALFEPMADAGRLYLVENADRRRQRRRLPEPAHQRERKHYRDELRRSSEPAQADGDVHPAMERRHPERQRQFAAGDGSDKADQSRGRRSRPIRSSTWNRLATRGWTRSTRSTCASASCSGLRTTGPWKALWTSTT